MKNAGFSLIEMAVVLTIISILLMGLMPTITSQIEQQRRTDTRKQMDEIRSALIGFAVANGRLPCPDTNNDGLENFSATAVTVNTVNSTSAKINSPCNGGGTLPYNDLGVAKLDAFGSNYVYNVSPLFAGKNIGRYSATNAGGTLLYTQTAGGFLLTDSSNITVCAGTTNAATSPCPNPTLTTNAAAIFVSKGANWNKTPSVEENENTDNDSDFISHDTTSSFDDLVMWVSPNTLFNRMVAAGKLP